MTLCAPFAAKKVVTLRLAINVPKLQKCGQQVSQRNCMDMALLLFAVRVSFTIEQSY